MKLKSCPTEEHIMQAAMQVFFEQGNISATMQEIADAAGVNRALLHYYFRSRDRLFQLVLKEAVKKSMQHTMELFVQELPMEERIRQVIDHMISLQLKYPHIHAFVQHEMNKNKELLSLHDEHALFLTRIKGDVEEMIARRGLPQRSAEHFMADLIALINHPSLNKTVLMHVHRMDEAAYVRFIEERKEGIARLLLRE